MENLLLAIVLFGIGYAVADYRSREKFGSELRRQREAAEDEAQRTRWTYTQAAKRMGIDVDCAQWYRVLDEEGAKYVVR
jgi:hypothetical protein